MKYFNKNKLIKKKSIFSGKKFFYFFIILLIFFLGVWSERFDFKMHIKNFAKETTNDFANKIYSIASNKTEKIIIDINYKNYLKILSSREKSIKSFRATEDIHKWVQAKMNYNNEDYKIKIKLKGVHNEHWKHPKKWSFKIKLLDNKSIEGIKRFSIQRPSTRDYLYEWLFMKTLQQEGLIFHRTKYLEPIVNGEKLGIYFFEEQHSKQLIENNKRREGPIIGLDKNSWIEEVNNINDLTINSLNESFLRAKIKPVQFKDQKIGTEQEVYLKNAIGLLEDFRKNKINIKNTFEIKELAKMMAIKAIFGSSEFDWRDIKFYYNPITSLLEPIGREVHINKNSDNLNLWWVSNSDINHNRSLDDKKFINMLLSDEIFYKFFLSELHRLTKDNYFDKIINKNKKEFLLNKKLLQFNFPLEETFSLKYLNNVKNVIRKTLNPIQGVNAYFVDYKNNHILLSVQNTQNLPVEINEIQFHDKKILKLNKAIVLKGKKNNQSLENYLLNIPCLKESNNNICQNYFDKKGTITENNKIVYTILGQKNKRETKILQFYPDKTSKTKNKLILDEKDLQTLPYLKFDNEKKEIYFHQKEIVISERLIIPAGYTVRFKYGIEIFFEGEGQIISYSPVIMKGKINDPIKLTSNIKETLSSNIYGNGLSIINAESKSLISNTIFSNLKSPQVKTGEGLLGSVNIYKSDISFEKCQFLNNKGEDFLNIISSNFSIKDVFMNQINYDAIDFDFSSGDIDGIVINNVGNDALDFSGSKVTARNIKISNAGDKGISAGEKSEISIRNLLINKAKIAVASKDLSQLEIFNYKVTNSDIGATAYQKKSEYGPGYININNIDIKNTIKTYLAQKRSIIKVNENIIPFTDINYTAF
jgi:hypothetical protein